MDDYQDQFPNLSNAFCSVIIFTLIMKMIGKMKLIMVTKMMARRIKKMTMKMMAKIKMTKKIMAKLTMVAKMMIGREFEIARLNCHLRRHLTISIHGSRHSSI